MDLPMIRPLHRLPGLIFGLLLMVLAGSGAVLSVAPALDRVQAPTQTPSLTSPNLAELAARALAQNPGLTALHQSPNGVILGSLKARLGFQTVTLDPATGKALAAADGNSFLLWVKELHRALFLDQTGHGVTGISAAVLTLLAGSGLVLLARSLGGWRRLARPVRAQGARGWHGRLARLALAGLLISGLTGSYMALAAFGLIDDGSALEAPFPETLAQGPAAPVAQLAALRALPVSALRDLTYPTPGDPTAAFHLTTDRGEAYVDPVSGQMLGWTAFSPARRIWEMVYKLHTGQGLWWLGLLLGASALMVPVLSVTGALIWLGRRRARPRLPHNARPGQADLVILVGSEGGATWGFAAALAKALQGHGLKIHTAAMNDLGDYPQAGGLVVMTSTYGDGAAPASARRFTARLAQARHPLPVAVLAFGDRMFASYCGYGAEVARQLETAGWPAFLPFARVDRQSSADFDAWVRDLGALLGLDLRVDPQARLPALTRLKLVSRQDYGAEVQAPVAVLRFRSARPAGWRGLVTPRLRHQAGDLLGILPPGSDLPRLYSLASSRRDGFVEIAVRKMPGGICSGWLNGLEPGAEIQAFVRPNPAFRPQARGPVILIAAGTGIGPMVGFLRGLAKGRGAEVYFGARDPDSDYLYRGELAEALRQGRLARLITAFSRVQDHAYVQDRLRADAAHLGAQIRRGGQVLVCGSLAMARAVAETVDEALAPLGLSVETLRAEGRYLEDVY